MPSKSEKQFKLMKAAASDKEYAEKRNIKQEIAKGWVYEDMTLAVVDKKHAELLGVTQDEAGEYIARHAAPNYEHFPLSAKW